MEKSEKVYLWTALCIAAAIFALYSVKDFKGPVAGTEQVYEGVVADRAMGTYHYEDWRFRTVSKPYVGVTFDGGGGECFYEADGYDFPAGIQIGDRVRVRGAVEEKSGVPIALFVEVLS